MSQENKKNIGIAVKGPEGKCDDDKCPFHGSVKLHGRILSGKVVSAKMAKFAVVEFGRQKFVPKYERYEKRRTRIHVHSPTCINAKVGDMVKIMESRKLSKTKNFVIIEKNEGK